MELISSNHENGSYETDKLKWNCFDIGTKQENTENYHEIFLMSKALSDTEFSWKLKIV